MPPIGSGFEPPMRVDNPPMQKQPSAFIPVNRWLLGGPSRTLPPVIRTLRLSGARAHTRIRIVLLLSTIGISIPMVPQTVAVNASPNYYDRFGNYTVTLTVTDDLGRTHSTDFPVAVQSETSKPRGTDRTSRITSSWKGMTLSWTGAVRRMRMRTVEMKLSPTSGTWMVTDSLMMRWARTQRCRGQRFKAPWIGRLIVNRENPPTWFLCESRIVLARPIRSRHRSPSIRRDPRLWSHRARIRPPSARELVEQWSPWTVRREFFSCPR